MEHSVSSPSPLVSIALATYNGGSFLRAQLDSLLMQDYAHLEIIISDDGSTDDTVGIIQEYQSRDARIHFFPNEKEHGIGANFANAIRHATGEWIALCDQDDIWMPQKISTLVAQADDYDMIYHDSLFVDEAGNSLDRKISDTLGCYTGKDPMVFLLENCVSGHACMFRRELVSLALPFPPARYHDWWLAFVAASRHGVFFHDEVLVHYSQHANSKTDILKKRSDYQHAGALKKFEQELAWYERCAAVDSCIQPVLARWVKEYRSLETKWFSPWLFQSARQHKRRLFRISGKNRWQRTKEIMAVSCGIPVRKWTLSSNFTA
jgi:glycosyltransferase involved in cell wall biosynthesis